MSEKAVPLSYWNAIEMPYTHPETKEVLYPIKGERESVWLCRKLYDAASFQVPKIEFICKKELLYYGTCGFVACDLDTDYHVRVEVGDHDDVEVTVPYEFAKPIIEHDMGSHITVEVHDTNGKGKETLEGVKDIVSEDDYDVAVVFNWDDTCESVPTLFRKLIHTTYKHRAEGQRLCDAVITKP